MLANVRGKLHSRFGSMYGLRDLRTTLLAQMQSRAALEEAEKNGAQGRARKQWEAVKATTRLTFGMQKYLKRLADKEGAGEKHGPAPDPSIPTADDPMTGSETGCVSDLHGEQRTKYHFIAFMMIFFAFTAVQSMNFVFEGEHKHCYLVPHVNKKDMDRGRMTQWQLSRVSAPGKRVHLRNDANQGSWRAHMKDAATVAKGKTVQWKRAEGRGTMPPRKQAPWDKRPHEVWLRQNKNSCEARSKARCVWSHNP